MVLLMKFSRADIRVRRCRKPDVAEADLRQPDKSAVTGHIMEKGHCMKFNKAHRLVHGPPG